MRCDVLLKNTLQKRTAPNVNKSPKASTDSYFFVRNGELWIGARLIYNALGKSELKCGQLRVLTTTASSHAYLHIA